MPKLAATAYDVAMSTDDISLVGLAARTQDAVVLAATRESVVLYSLAVMGAALAPEPPQYVWKVDGELAEHARRFVETLNALFGEKLPPPGPDHAKDFWCAFKDNNFVGRCVRLGFDDSTQPIGHYHWAIRRSGRNEYAVHEFWKTEIWTTEQYCSEFYPERGFLKR